MNIDQSRKFHNTSAPYILPNDAPEWQRLDELHAGLDFYLGHQLSHAPVKGAKEILEIGCGSGAWAIQAAKIYPDAIITAIDISPLPPRALPPNIRFFQLDATEELPFDPESFDIVHSRFVLVHLPHWELVLQRMISLLKPRGWLLIEDIVMHVYDNSLRGIGPSTHGFNDIYLRYMRERNVDPLYASSLQSTLEMTAKFSEVNSILIRCPMNGNDEDPTANRIGRIVYTTLHKALEAIDPRLFNAGLTYKLMQGLFAEIKEASRDSYMKVHMVWSQKN